MTPERWQRIESLVLAALELDPLKREEFLSRECAEDEVERTEVASLLAVSEQSQDFLKAPAVVYAGYLPSEADESLAGQQYGVYKILRKLGHGGMGVVYLAAREDAQFRQEVALKLIKRGLDTDEILERFRNERQILASLNHPNIARLFDGGTSPEGLPYFVMEYVDGLSLLQYSAGKHLSVAERLELFRTICAAVQHAHQNLVIHRDLKPSNILVTADGVPKLLDFGVAKLLNPESNPNGDVPTRGPFRVMTPDYASPEQIAGAHVTTATDVYSLGVILYELLTGAKPYKLTGTSAEELSRAIFDREPSKPSDAVNDGSKQQAISRNPKALRGDIDNIVLMALRKDPERRYKSVEQFSDDIDRHLHGMPVIARKDTFGYRATKFIQRHKVAVSAAALIVLTLLAGIAMTVQQKRRADRRFNDVRRMATAFILESDDEIQKGPTRARALLVKRALEYLDRLSQENNDDGLKLEMAVGYLKIGDIQGKPYRPNLGDTQGAIASYTKAITLLQSLTSLTPTNLEARRYLGLAFQSLARVNLREGNWAVALESQRKALEVSEALLAVNPNYAPYRDQVANGYRHFGEVLYQPERGANVADHYEAVNYFRRALAIHESLVAADPGNSEYRYALSVDYEFVGIGFNKIGDLTGDSENYRQALENHLQEKEINESLAAGDPSNGVYRRIMADVYGEVGLSLMKLGRNKEASENLRQRLAIFEQVRASDPANIEAQRDVANSLNELGEALVQSGELTGGLVQQRKAISILESLTAAEPTNTQSRRTLLRAYDAEADVLIRSGEIDGALASFHKALAIIENWATSEPQSLLARRLIATEQTNIGKAYSAAATGKGVSQSKRRADLRSAQDWYQRSVTTWEKLQAEGHLSQSDQIKLDELKNAIASVKP